MNLKEFEIVIVPPPHDDCIWVKIVALIRDNETYEVKEYPTGAIWDEATGNISDYIWREGNFSCDCNRGLFFGKEEVSCGEGRYAVNIVNPKNNQIIYSEY